MPYRRTVLPGGARVLTDFMPGLKSATVGLWVGTGSRDEPAGMEGACHLVEHLIFKGTANRSAREVAEAFDLLGGEINGFAEREFTCVHARVLTDDLVAALELLTDLIWRPALREQDVSAEKRVIVEEISSVLDNPEELVHKTAYEGVFGLHPLARDVPGRADSVIAISPRALTAFHAAHYLPSNIVVSAAGQVDHGRLSEVVERLTPPSDEQTPHRSLREPEPGAGLKVIRRRCEQTHIVVAGAGLSRDHAARFAFAVLDSVLGGGVSSRLFREIREERSLAYAVYSTQGAYADAGIWGAYAATSPGNAGEVLKLMSAELDRLVEEPISEEELDRAKRHIRGGLALSLEDPYYRMSRLGEAESTSAEKLAPRDVLRRIDAVDVEQVSRVARELLSRDRRVLALVGPHSARSIGRLWPV